MSLDAADVVFSTRYNILKTYSNETVVASVPSSPSTPSSVLLTTHNLGYVPTVRAYYEPVAGELWPMTRDQFGNLGGGPGTTLLITGTIRITSTAVYAEIYNSTGSTANVTFYVRVYIDE